MELLKRVGLESRADHMPNEDLPEPDFPMIATNSPRLMVRFIFFSPRTLIEPVS